MEYKSPPVGNQILCTMYGVDKELIKDGKKLEKLLIDALNQEKFNIVDVKSYLFNPHGYTVISVLAESHAIIHTYPEYESVDIDIYSCRGPEGGRTAYEYIKKELAPSSVSCSERKVIIDEKYNKH